LRETNVMSVAWLLCANDTRLARDECAVILVPHASRFWHYVLLSGVLGSFAFWLGGGSDCAD
jgi:hypothetical protein